MKFRPCIDIHNGKVKQIVGGSLRDEGDRTVTHFISRQDARWYAELYKRDSLKGGHIILLNPPSSRYYEVSRERVFDALAVYPGGLQVGGSVTPCNGQEYLKAGASHVIVTSWLFENGRFKEEKLKELADYIGKKHLVLDLSCRRRGDAYCVVTDRWQTFTDMYLTPEALTALSLYCDEFLIHGADVEGKSSGMEQELVQMLADWNKIPITYAGGIGSLRDLEAFEKAGAQKLDFTIGSALSLFGGQVPYETVAGYKVRHIPEKL